MKRFIKSLAPNQGRILANRTFSHSLRQDRTSSTTRKILLRGVERTFPLRMSAIYPKAVVYLRGAERRYLALKTKLRFFLRWTYT